MHVLYSTLLDTQRRLTLHYSFSPYWVAVSYYCSHSCPWGRLTEARLPICAISPCDRHQPFTITLFSYLGKVG